MPRPVTKTTRFELRLSDAGEAIIAAIAESDGRPRAYVVEEALRLLADWRGMDYPGADHRNAIRGRLAAVTGRKTTDDAPATPTADAGKG